MADDEGKAFGAVYCIFCLIVMPLFAITGIVVEILGLSTITFSSADKSELINLEWQQPFISEVYLSSSGSCDRDDSFPLIRYDWQGIDHMCIDQNYYYARGATCQMLGLESTNKKQTTY